MKNIKGKFYESNVFDKLHRGKWKNIIKIPINKEIKISGTMGLISNIADSQIKRIEKDIYKTVWVRPLITKLQVDL